MKWYLREYGKATGWLEKALFVKGWEADADKKHFV
jgi:hypothetical protein